ncbi:hypothetical protein [Flavobacterium sp.]|uniref:hypothetical protein n=1 Tax=Flavobacterium sp. TaxID=239 RepID=UPI002606852F|nr:hypothetical protein [Flavobacterium sp.]
MTEQTQQEFLQKAKAALGVKWDELAERVGIEPRTLKSYRLPPNSKGYRGMDKFVRQAVIDALKKAKKSI